MNRRNLLIVIGVSTTLSGCVEDETEQKSAEADNNETSESTEESESDSQPEPANLVLENISIDPSEPNVGDEVNISVVVKNTGGESGLRTIDFQVNGNLEGTKEVELKPGGTTTVEFSFTADNTGSYEVTIGDLQGGFEVTASPEITISDQKLSTVDSVFHNSYVEAVVENVGNAACGSIEIAARWFDDSGSFVGESTTRLPSLGVGEVWAAKIGTSREKGEISDYELSGEYDISLGTRPSGLSVEGSNFNVENENSGTITSEINNTREEELFMATFSGKIYDDSGRVIGGRSTRESDISPGEDLFFELSLSRTRIVHRITDATDHEVLVTKSENNETRQIQQ